MSQPLNAVFIDPSSEHFLEDRLFDIDNAHLNRDGTLLPFWRLREALARKGVPVHTADYLRRGEFVAKTNHYWSIGLLNGYKSLIGRNDVRLRGFMLFEPPLQLPKMYKALPELSKYFDGVYIHNIYGDGYSLNGVEQEKLQKMYWPQPYDSEIEPFWSNGGRLNKVVAISGNHNPRFRRPELYSRRIEAVAELIAYDGIDLYGRGWDRWWSKNAAWPSYWRHFTAIRKAYRGSCVSKLDVLSRYRFCLCLENMPMTGYLTEKLFDCFYAGTVPLYLGAPDIDTLVPSEAYVDIRCFPSFTAMYQAILGMPDSEWQKKREAARNFLCGKGREVYFDFLPNVFAKDFLIE